MGRLIIHRAEGNLEFELNDRASIGRHPNNSIHLADRLVSKEHCLIFLDQNGNYVIRDLGSQNGTFVNSRQLSGEGMLRDGDHITLGETRCIFSRGVAEVPGWPIEADGTVLILSQTASKIPEDRFLPEKEIWDEKVLRADYEKLRMAHELYRDIGVALHIELIFQRIIERTFELLDCDRAVILTPDDNGTMVIRASKTRNKTDRLIVSSTILKHVQDEKVGIVSSDALTDERFAGAESVILQNIRSSMTVPILHEKQLLGIMMIDSAAAVKAYTEKDLLLFGNIANQTAQFIKIAEMARQIEIDARTRERFQRLLSPALAEMVVSGKLKVEKGGKNRIATVLFADIRGFTAICEHMPAAEVLQMLNEYFELMVEAAFRYEGTIDKFVGDQIMVVWGAPVIHPDDPIRALRAALEMQKAINQYSTARRKKGQAEIKIGIGINTGELVAGYIGSTQTMSYSVIGDEVNTASRLCAAAGAGDILLAENTFLQVQERFELIKLAPVQVKGKSKPVEVYRLLGEKSTLARTGRSIQAAT
jgi:adenylate cyclase